ncbi:MAG TPA: hypothetical protein VHB02_06465 [Acidimicrobiales bacterium]|nr:hypothetical protein [Acidimicrobiales bacterium]
MVNGPFSLLLDLVSRLQGTDHEMGHLSLEDERVWLRQQRSFLDAAARINDAVSWDEVNHLVNQLFDVESFRSDGSFAVQARCLAYAIATLRATKTFGDIRSHYASLSGEGTEVDGRFKGRRRLRRGDPIPLLEPAVRRVVRTERATKPESLPYEQAPCRVPGMDLAPSSVETFACWLDYSLADVALIPEAVATGHPIASGFDSFNHSPLDGTLVTPQTVLDNIMRILEFVGGCGVGLVVLPEGVLSGAIKQTVETRWRSLDPAVQPTIVVPGSTWEPSGDEEVTNQATVWAVNKADMPDKGHWHRKFERVRKTKGPLYPAHLERLSDTPRSITVHVLAGGMKLAMLICRDLLNPAATRLLEDLGVDVLAVPSLSSNVQPMAEVAAYRATNWNLTTVIANTPMCLSGDDERVYSIVGRPRRDERVLVARNTPEEICAIPGVYVVNEEGNRWEEVAR